MRYLLILLPVLGFAPPSHQVRAQPLECGPDDRQCLEESYGLACSQTEASCLDWLQQVQTHDLAQNPEWRLIAAAGYSELRSLADSPEDADRYRELSYSSYREMLQAWPDGYYAAQAYTGMATHADDPDDSIVLLRNAVNADPSNSITPYFLARRLQRRGQDDDYREAADLYRAAYSLTTGYYYAANALGLYTRTGQTERAAEFKAEIARDSGMADFPEEVASARFAQDLERAAVVLDTACRVYVIAIFGPATCAAGIDTLVAATRTANSLAERRSIVDVATEGMRMLTVAGAGAGTAEEKARRESRFGAIYREWIAADTATAATYVRWAQHPESDLDEYVSALERAVELAPDNGRYRYWLAHGYIDQGRFDEAIEHFNIARDTLPENMGITIESVDRGIREAETARDIGR